jgi:hypothetical protein
MKETKQTTPMIFAELVDETVEYYTNNPRSSVRRNIGSGTSCKYAGPNGERCAAARLCDESATDLEAMDKQCQSAWGDVCHMATLKPEYAHFSIGEIEALQDFHDNDSYWLDPYGESGAGGLSVEGKKKACRFNSLY